MVSRRRRPLPLIFFALGALVLGALAPASGPEAVRGAWAPGVAHADRTYRVRPGDTLSRIARRFRVSTTELRRANRLRSDALRAGQRLRIPGARESRAIARRAGLYIVRSGDNLGRIARRHGVSIAALRRANHLRSDRIRVGQRLQIPGRRRENRAPRLPPRPPRPDQEQARAEAERVGLGPVAVARRLLGGSPEPAWLALAETAPAEIPAHAYGVGTPIARGGETVSSRVEGEPDEAEAAGDDDALEAGDEFDDSSVTEELEDEEVDDTPVAEEGPAEEVGGVADDAHTEDEVEPTEEEADGQADEATGGDPHVSPEGDVLAYEAARDLGPGGGPGTLHSPLADGLFLRGWGSGVNGYHLALDLYAPPNTPVLAAERGVVVYAGAEMRGYGRVVLVLHPNGWVTTYAHNNELLVVPGERVARGQVIALLGNTGISRGPHVHFMLVVDGAHCDALPLLRPTPRRRGHDDFRVTRLRWDDPEEPPVRCARREDRPHPSEARRHRARARRRARATRRRPSMSSTSRMGGE